MHRSIQNILDKQARDAELRKQIEEDMKREQAFERRAAFGPGVEVVNVITGEKFFT